MKRLFPVRYDLNFSVWHAHVPEPPSRDPERLPEVPPPLPPEEDIDLPSREEPPPVREPDQPVRSLRHDVASWRLSPDRGLTRQAQTQASAVLSSSSVSPYSSSRL